MLTTASSLYKEKKFKKCFLELIKLSHQFSNDLKFLDLMYKVQIKLGDVQAAMKTITVIVNKCQSVESRIEKMNLLMSLNRHNEALDIGLSLQIETKTDSEEKHLFHMMTDIYTVFNDFEGLQELLTQSSHTVKSEAVYYYAQGLLDIYNENMHQAILNLRHSLEINPSLDRAWVSLAIMHYKMGDQELALANIEKALDINKNNPVAIKCYAIWKEKFGDYNAACEKVSGYLEKNNFDKDFIKKEIELLHKLGRTDAAFNEEIKLAYYFGQI